MKSELMAVISSQKNDTSGRIMAHALKNAEETKKRHEMQITQLSGQNQLQEHQLQVAAPNVKVFRDCTFVYKHI